MELITYKGKKPQLGTNIFIAEGAKIIGDVKLADNVNIWFNAVLRGDINSILVGENTNIQDNVTCHVDYPPDNLIIGENVTVGHNAILHACIIGSNTLIGMGAIVLSRAKIGKNCVIGAGALVLEATMIPDNSLVVGVPGKVVRQLNEKEIKALEDSAKHYIEVASYYDEGRGNK